MQSSKWLSKKLAVFGFLAVILTSFITPAVSSAVTTDTGGGGGSGSSYTEMTPDKQAMSYALYYGVLKCVTGINSISNDDVINGSVEGAGGSYMASWYADHTYGDGSDGKLSCETVFSNAVSLWGYSDLGAALSDWGYTSDGKGGDWKNDNPGTDAGNALRQRVYGGNNPVSPGASTYLTYRFALEQACQIVAVAPSDVSTAIKNAANATSGPVTYIKVTEPKADFSDVQTAYYKVGRTIDTNLTWPLNSPTGKSDGFLNCRDLASKASKYAGEYVTWARENKEAALGISTTSAVAGGNTEGNGDNCPLDPGASMRWLGCAIFFGLRDVADKLTSTINTFLYTPTDIFNEPAAQRTAYMFRNLGIGLIVIAGLLMVIAQASGSELVDAYTIRKLMPRLAVAMIAMAVSWPILKFAVTLTNDLGALVYSVFITMATGGATVGGAGAAGATVGGGSGITAIMIGIAAGGYIAVTLGALGSISLILSIVLALFIGLIVLSVRQLIIFMAVIMAPIAIAAYVLPGTQKLWGFWKIPS